MANLESFKARIGGGVRPNQFSVEITGAPVTFTGLDFLCHAASLPGSTIGQAPVFHRGRVIPLAGERTFNPWNITIYADQALAIRSQFEVWSNLMNDYANASGETDPNSYKAQAIVTQLDRNDLVVKTYNIVGIFPVDISEIQLAWQQNDTVEEFTVTFAVERVDPLG